jgi:3',5'-cyclic AMP phosphodiesterase CpdA
MARVVHLSDLHFGAHDDRLVKAVELEVDALKPDLVVISGDFTQRARTEQFSEACAFLERLRGSGNEVLGVPGNHDVPLYDVLRRFLSPLARYRRFIDDSLCPFVELPGIAVLGINTARSLTFKDGRINKDQVDFIRETFARAPSESVRVLVIQAGTATSTRVREQEQSFNVIDIDDGSVTVTIHACTGSAFKAADAQPYKHRDGRWQILKAEAPAH